MKITIVVGNPKPNSRTERLARLMVENLFPDPDLDLQVIDLAEHLDELFAWPSEKMSALNNRVAESDLAVFATPTYKASYTGLLKAFLDRYPQNGLNGVVSLVLMTGAGRSHSLAPNVALVPLLLELGALVPVGGTYFNTERMDKAEEIIDAAATDILRAFSRFVPVLQGAASRMQEVDNVSKAEPQKETTNG